MKTFPRSIVSLDLETTGPRPDADRIVEIGVVRMLPDGTRFPGRWRINPGMPIPPEATAVHHITDDDVSDEPAFKSVAAEIATMLRNTDLTGFNLRAFDLPVLRREFQLAGVPWPCEGARVVDSYVIFKEREPRTLGAAVRWYCGREMVDAHSAAADAEAALDVLIGQLGRYPDLAALDIEALDAASGGRRPDWATELGHLRWDAGGDLIVAFGKHSGRVLRSLDYGFLAWIAKNDFPADVKQFVQRTLRGERVRAPNAPPLPSPPPVGARPPAVRPNHDDDDLPF